MGYKIPLVRKSFTPTIPVAVRSCADAPSHKRSFVPPQNLANSVNDCSKRKKNKQKIT